MHVYTKDQVMQGLALTRRQWATAEEKMFTLRDGVFTNLDFTGEDLRGLNCPHSNWLESSLCRANCSGMDAHASHMSHIDLQRATLVDTNFHQTELDHVSMVQANCSGMHAPQVQWYAVNASHANFSMAVMDHCLFLGAGEDEEGALSLNGARFTGTFLIGTSFSDIDATNASFRSANLQMTVFNQACLIGADCSYANCYGADLRGASLEGATFAYANLENTLFASVDQLKRANLYTIHEAFLLFLSTQPRDRVEHYYQQLCAGEDPHLIAFFHPSPVVEYQSLSILTTSMSDTQRAEIIVHRFVNNQRDRKSHPVSLLLKEWLDEWFLLKEGSTY